MARTRIITGAPPGGFTDQVLLPRSFGKEKVYSMNFGCGLGTTFTTTQQTGPMGTTFGTASGESEQTNYGFSEKDEFVFGPNETSELNNDPAKFVLHPSPGHGLSNFGGKPIICKRGEPHLTIDEIKMWSDRAFEATRQETENVTPADAPSAALSPEKEARRRTLLSILERIEAISQSPNANHAP